MDVATKQRQMLALFQLEEMEGGIFDQVFEPCTKRMVDWWMEIKSKIKINIELTLEGEKNKAIASMI
jgi:hypothetical protein